MILFVFNRFTSEDNSTEEESSDKDFQLLPRHSAGSSEDASDRSSRRKGIDQVDGAGDTDVGVICKIKKINITIHTQDGSEADLLQPKTRRGGFSATVGIAGPKSFKPEKLPQKYVLQQFVN